MVAWEVVRVESVIIFLSRFTYCPLFSLNHSIKSHSGLISADKMALKRKLSDLTESPYSEPSSATTSSRDSSTSPIPDVALLDNNPTRWNQTRPWLEEPSSHLGSRTRKRFRDSRPDEKTIHGKLLSPCAKLSTSYVNIR